MELIDLSDSYMNKIILSLARIFLGKAKNAPLVLWWCILPRSEGKWWKVRQRFLTCIIKFIYLFSFTFFKSMFSSFLPEFHINRAELPYYRSATVTF